MLVRQGSTPRDAATFFSVRGFSALDLMLPSIIIMPHSTITSGRTQYSGASLEFPQYLVDAHVLHVGGQVIPSHRHEAVQDFVPELDLLSSELHRSSSVASLAPAVSSRARMAIAASFAICLRAGASGPLVTHAVRALRMYSSSSTRCGAR